MSRKYLGRSRTDRVVAGVCGGLGRYLGINANLLRILWLILLPTGVGILAYFICAVAIPMEPLQNPMETQEVRRPAPPPPHPFEAEEHGFDIQNAKDIEYRNYKDAQPQKRDPKKEEETFWEDSRNVKDDDYGK